MLKARKQKIIKQNSQEREALKYLSLISEKQTGYLEDWTKINQIKEQDIEQSRQLAEQANASQRQQRAVENIIATSLSERSQLIREKAERVNLSSREKKKMDVQVEDFATIPHRKSLMKIRKSELANYKKNESESQFHTLAHQQVPEDQTQRYGMEKKFRQSASLNYMDKIRQLSLPWIKHIPREQKNQVFHPEKEIKARQETRRLSELIKNKIRRKHSNKFILQRQKLDENQNEEMLNKNIGVQDSVAMKLSSNQEMGEGIDSNEIKILKNWLDYNRSKRKRSITSLLNEHFQFKYLEKKKQRQRAMALKSLKAISAQSHFNHQRLQLI